MAKPKPTLIQAGREAELPDRKNNWWSRIKHNDFNTYQQLIDLIKGYYSNQTNFNSLTQLFRWLKEQNVPMPASYGTFANFAKQVNDGEIK